MLQFFLRWICSAVALYITVLIGETLHIHIWLASGVKGFEAAFVTATVLGVVNAVIRPILSLLALPITCLTLGLFSFVINAALFWIVVHVVNTVVPGINVAGFWGALFGSVVMSIVGGLLGHFIVAPTTQKREEDAQ